MSIHNIYTYIIYLDAYKMVVAVHIIFVLHDVINMYGGEEVVGLVGLALE